MTVDVSAASVSAADEGFKNVKRSHESLVADSDVVDIAKNSVLCNKLNIYVISRKKRRKKRKKVDGVVKQKRLRLLYRLSQLIYQKTNRKLL
jgi:hypothetical protein